MVNRLKLVSPAYLDEYNRKCNIDWLQAIQQLKSKAGFTPQDFEYCLIASSLFSSKIEGNSLDFNSFYRNRGKKDVPKRKEVEEIEDLVKAYKFASENNLSVSAFLQAHKLFSATLVKPSERGKFRKDQVGVYDRATGRPVYMAVEPQFVKDEMAKLFEDIQVLLDRKLSTKEVFYYASMLHLWIAMVHPFADGNGRAARLLEKWFLVSKLAEGAWSVNSEKYYWDHRPEYYANISPGFNYYTLKWERCVPFLSMLVEGISG